MQEILDYLQEVGKCVGASVEVAWGEWIVINFDSFGSEEVEGRGIEIKELDIIGRVRSHFKPND